MFSLSKRSMAALEGVHPDLVRTVLRAITITPQDFLITCGVRTPAEQRALYAKGRNGVPGPKVTWTLVSNHFKKADGYGHAVDLCPYPVDWSDLKKFKVIADAMKAAAKTEGVAIGWGGSWRNQPDSPHFELSRP